MLTAFLPEISYSKKAELLIIASVEIVRIDRIPESVKEVQKLCKSAPLTRNTIERYSLVLISRT
ncbi:MAG TPA: hypothetical protein VJ044_17485 [Candidatus Hodarchaeales archaeon]|nr:hypothetical protein [Candidatus Hodarchaeales archaeon]